MKWLQAVVFEVFAIPLVIFLQILGYFWKPSFSQKSEGTPIILVHGYLNTGAIWLYLKWKFRNLGPIYAISLKGPFTSIENHAEQLEKLVEKIGKECILVGYSMGGLVCAYYAIHLAKKNQVKKIITISTPFYGTHAAKIAVGKNANQMHRGSLFLRNLRHEIQRSNVPIYTIASKMDEIIIPYTSARLEKSQSFIFGNLGHAGLLFSPKVASVVIHLIVA